MLEFHGRLAAHNDAIAKTTGARPGFFIRTYGCQMNSRDSEKLAALLTQLGYAQAENQESAELVLYNTCCVRESAENKIFGHLSRLKNIKETQRPNMIIAVGGCMSQQSEIAEDIRSRHSYIDIVFGTANRHRLPQFIWTAISTGKQVIDITEDEDLPELDSVPVTTREYPHKAGVNIMYGCDNYCSYCIVPYVRGRERSRPAADILREVEALAEDGVKEIMLLGQNVNSYGKGLGEDLDAEGLPYSKDASTRLPRDLTPIMRLSSVDFPNLLRNANQIPGIERIRFMTSHPRDFSYELIAAMHDSQKVCKSVHLPLQSGSTRVLADMNRHYTQAQYLDLVRRIKEAIPGIAITTDIIVGYPGETDADFEQTLEVVQQVRFAGAFTFIYSKRSGTPAASRTDLVPRKIANQRFERLTAALYPIMDEINHDKIGKVWPVMVESIEGNACKGRTDDNTLVHFSVSEDTLVSARDATLPKHIADNFEVISYNTVRPGQIIPVLITSARTFYVSGEMIPNCM